MDRYFTELLQLAANVVDLVEAGYVVPDFLNRIIEMGCQRWAQLEIDRIKSTDKVVESFLEEPSHLEFGSNSESRDFAPI